MAGADEVVVIYTDAPASTVQHADFSIDTTWGTYDDHAVAIPRKQEQRLTRCGPAQGGLRDL